MPVFGAFERRKVEARDRQRFMAQAGLDLAGFGSSVFHGSREGNAQPMDIRYLEMLHADVGHRLRSHRSPVVARITRQCYLDWGLWLEPAHLYAIEEA